MRPCRHVLSLTSLVIMTSLIATPMYAADEEASPTRETAQPSTSASQDESRVRAVDEWSYQPLYEQGGFSADSMLGAKLFSPQGNEIGNMVNVVLDQENQIVTIIAEVGGVWDSGDRHVAIPWDEVELSEGNIKVPVRQDNVEEYDLLTDVMIDEAYIHKQEMERVSRVEEDVSTGPQTWKITDILDDYASLKEGTGYGYITDALFSSEGIMQAIIINPANVDSGKGGPRAYPFYGYRDGWRPGDSHYRLPYAQKDVEQLPVFDYEQYDSDVK